MKKTLLGLLALMMVGGLVSLAQAANPVNFNVTVNVVHTLSVSYNSADVTSYADLGIVNPDGSAVASIGGIRITNNGTGLAETYALNLTNPTDWTASTTAGADTYVLNAAFDSTGGPSPWDPAKHALTTSLVASSVTQFAGDDQTGLNVPWNEVRDLWFEFTPPTMTTLTGVQSIAITITAQ